MLARTAGTTYERLRAQFRWELPERFNIGVACADKQAAAALALVEVLDTRGEDVREHTFGQLAELSSRFANGLASLGVGRGDRVGIMLPQGLEVAVAHLGVYKLGAIAVPLTQLFGPEAVRHRLGDCEARAVVTDHAALETVDEVVRELTDVQVVVAGDAAAPYHGLTDLVNRGSAQLPTAGTTPDDPALLIYTSGTTGAPKGALHGHRLLLGHLPGFELAYDFFPHAGDRMWTPADWAWIGGLFDAVLPAWYYGRPVIAAPRRRFDPEWAVRLMADHRVRNAFLPPTALKLLRQAEPRPDAVALRSVMSGGEPLGAETLAWGEAHLGVTINEIYGQTEANLLVGNCASVWPPRPGSMGRPYPGHDVAVMGSEGELAPPGTDGEIVARFPDPVMMLGYWNNPAATADKYTSEWLRTGDVGHADDDGYLWFTARDDDIIVSAGYRIGPGEIEECLMGHDAVAMCAVIGVPDDVRGSVPKAFVQLAAGFKPSAALEAEIADHVRHRLASYEYPRTIQFVADLPLTTTGKIRRRALRELHERGVAPPRPPDATTTGPEEPTTERTSE